MGFDLYGRGPFSTDEPIYPKSDDSEKKEKYFAERQKFEKNNPGHYFRNNVWWWRPLWEFICDVAAKDILTLEDAERGCYNDNWLIGKTKAKRIAKNIYKLHEVGAIKKYKEEREKFLDKLPEVECNSCDGSGYRNMDDSNVSTVCTTCKGKGKREDFDTNYPFDVENVIDFAIFCEHSGGFRIG